MKRSNLDCHSESKDSEELTGKLFNPTDKSEATKVRGRNFKTIV